MCLLCWLNPFSRCPADMLGELLSNQRKIMTTQAELAAQLTALKTQNDKARAEVLAKIAELEAALAGQSNVTPEVETAFAALKASVQTDDDIVPDAPAAP